MLMYIYVHVTVRAVQRYRCCKNLLCRNDLSMKSDKCVSTATLTYDTLRFAEFEDFPETSEPVWILGRKYSIFTGIVHLALITSAEVLSW